MSVVGVSLDKGNLCVHALEEEVPYTMGKRDDGGSSKILEYHE